jgi:hypothetical protein
MFGGTSLGCGCHHDALLWLPQRPILAPFHFYDYVHSIFAKSPPPNFVSEQWI